MTQQNKIPVIANGQKVGEVIPFTNFQGKHLFYGVRFHKGGEERGYVQTVFDTSDDAKAFAEGGAKATAQPNFISKNKAERRALLKRVTILRVTRKSPKRKQSLTAFLCRKPRGICLRVTERAKRKPLGRFQSRCRLF